MSSALPEGGPDTPRAERCSRGHLPICMPVSGFPVCSPAAVTWCPADGSHQSATRVPATLPFSQGDILSLPGTSCSPPQ